MPIEHTDHSSRRKPLRLWPGIAFAALLGCFHLAVPLLGPAGPPLRFLGGIVAGLLILLWWLFFSRAPWSERIGAIGDELTHQSLETLVTVFPQWVESVMPVQKRYKLVSREMRAPWKL